MSNADESMLKVRELLFGEHMQEIEKTFSSLTKKQDQLHSNQSKKVKDIENSLTTEISNLKDYLEIINLKNGDEFVQTHQLINSTIEEAKSKLSSDLEKTKKLFSNDSLKIKESIKDLKIQMNEKLEEIKKRSNADILEIRKKYVSRELLSEILIGIAGAISEMESEKEQRSKNLN